MEGPLTFDLEADEVAIFLQDVNEHLQAMEANLLRLEQPALTDRQSQEALNAAFRAAHTLKAIAATVGHHAMADLTHALETCFDALRAGHVTPSADVVDGLLVTADALKALRDEVVTREPGGVAVGDILAQLRALTAGIESVPDAPARPAAFPETRPLTPEETALAQDYLHQQHLLLEISAAVDAEAFAPAARLLQASMALLDAGEILAQQPTQGDLANEQHAGHLWAVLATPGDPQAARDLLNDVADLTDVRVRPYTFAAVSAGARDQDTAAPEPSTSLATPPTSAAPEIAPEGTVRISVERLDTLMNLVGELVTNRTRMEQVERHLREQYGRVEIVESMGETVSDFGRVVDQLQEEVMQARMLPVAQLFNKLPRLVRDVARAADKDVDFVVEGASTELDRSIIEAIGDPLMHLLRNAVDHGIERPQVRAAVGKPRRGTVRLAARHQEGHIVIEVADDGRGIDPASVRATAVRRGALSEEEAAQLSDDDAVALIFQPNFSTAEQVTKVSGRGVGLDVVQTNVKRLGGTVVVESEVGHGTTFRLTLPLTLAILQTMLVRLGDDTYAIPLASIVETLYAEDWPVNRVKGQPMVHWRDQALPLLPLRTFFAHPRRAAPPNGSGDAIVVVAWGKQRAGLIVDRLIGKQEIVIKSLSPVVGNVPGLSGCAILGDGRVALIVDVPGLIGAALQARRNP